VRSLYSRGCFSDVLFPSVSSDDLQWRLTRLLGRRPLPPYPACPAPHPPPPTMAPLPLAAPPPPAAAAGGQCCVVRSWPGWSWRCGGCRRGGGRQRTWRVRCWSTTTGECSLGGHGGQAWTKTAHPAVDACTKMFWSTTRLGCMYVIHVPNTVMIRGHRSASGSQLRRN
jgi:hypothetical protein